MAPIVDRLIYWPLIVRIIYHATLLLSYPILAMFALSFLTRITLVAAAGFLVICLLILSDYMAIERRLPSLLFFFVDFCWTAALIPLLWSVDLHLFLSRYNQLSLSAWQKMLWDTDPPFTIAFWMPRIICGVYLLFLVVTAFTNQWLYGHAFGPFFAIPYAPAVNFVAGEPVGFIVSIFGERRSPEERDAVASGCGEVLFKHTLFRKHPFEPAVLGFIRGLVAAWACLGLLAYAVLLIFEAERAFQAGNTVQMSQARITSDGQDPYIVAEVWFGTNAPNVYVQSNAVDHDRENRFVDIEINIPQAQPSGGTCNSSPETNPPTYDWLNCTFPNAGNGYSDQETPYESLYISISSNISVSVWILDSFGIMPCDFTTARNLTEPFILEPNTHIVGTISVTKYTQGNLRWLSYAPTSSTLQRDMKNTSFAVNSSSLFLSTFFPGNTRWIEAVEINTPSIISEALDVISKLGGVNVILNGIFTMIFGRGMVSVILGGRPISPFGIFSSLSWFRRRIHDRYPSLKDDVEKGGMASYVEEVGMDAGIVRRSKRRRNPSAGTEEPMVTNVQARCTSPPSLPSRALQCAAPESDRLLQAP